MFKTLIFRIGLLPFIFLIWAWRDSTLNHSTSASVDFPGISGTAYHSLSRIHVDFYTGVEPTSGEVWIFSRTWHAPGEMRKSPFSITGGPFPAPGFTPELPDNPEDYNEEELARAEKGESAGTITLPYWLLAVLNLGSLMGLSFWWARRRTKLQIAEQPPACRCC